MLGIVGGLIAFISLAMPWWTVAFSWSLMGIDSQTSVSVYLFQAKTGLPGYYSSPPPSQVDLWFGWIALVPMVIGGLMGMVGGLRQHGKMIFVSGLFVLASMTVFAVGLQSELSKGPIDPWGFSVPGLFSSGISHLDTELPLESITYMAYLTYGFWTALSAAVIMLAAPIVKRVHFKTRAHRVKDLENYQSLPFSIRAKRALLLGSQGKHINDYSS